MTDLHVIIKNNACQDNTYVKKKMWPES